MAFGFCLGVSGLLMSELRSLSFALGTTFMRRLRLFVFWGALLGAVISSFTFVLTLFSPGGDTGMLFTYPWIFACIPLHWIVRLAGSDITLADLAFTSCIFIGALLLNSLLTAFVALVVGIPFYERRGRA